MKKLKSNGQILATVSEEEVGAAGPAPAIEQNGAAGQTTANPNNNDGSKPSVDSSSTKKKSPKKASEVPLTQEQIDALKHETEVFEQEVARMLADPRYHAIRMPNGRVIMDLTAAHKDGIPIYRFDYNRTHGRDEDSTGESIKADGAQHPLLVVPVKVALAAGLPISHFQKDPDQASPIDEDGLGSVDGHGRANNAYGSKEWPQLDAVLPVKNSNGYIDTKKVYSVTNEKIAVWGSKDHLIPRLFDPNELREKALKAIRDLVARDYLYTAACDWALWKIGNVTKAELNAIVDQAGADKFMEYMQHGKRIHEACVKKFGEGDDKLLKTKKFPEALIEKWNALRDKKGVDQATETMVKFIEQLEPKQAFEITSAKKDKDKDLDKDTVRKQLLNTAFKEFMSKTNP
jgi:hypothetical protein